MEATIDECNEDGYDDEDGYGEASGERVTACEQPSG